MLRVIVSLTFIALFTRSVSCQTPAATLTNVDIIQMHNLGLGDDVVIAKIVESNNLNFDTSLDGLKTLKQSGISDAVLKAMIAPHPAVASTRIVDSMAVKFKSLSNGVFTVWTEFGHGTGFLVSSDGLVLTNQHVVGPSEYIALQFDEKRKIPAVLLASDPKRDVAVLWADLTNVPEATSLQTAQPGSSEPTLVEGERVFTIGSPLNQQKVITSGIASKIEKTAIISDLNINPGNSGGPLFNSQGQVVGITTFGDVSTSGGPGISGIVKIEEADSVLHTAREKMSATAKPPNALLPVDPPDSFPIDSLKATITEKKFDEKPYLIEEDDFDIALITPPFEYYEEHLSEMKAISEKDKRNKNAGSVQGTLRPLDDLKSWEQYVGEYKPVLMVRVMPHLEETTGSIFLRALAGEYPRAAKVRFKMDFYKMKLVCGDREIAPILPGKIAHVLDVHSEFVNATDATYEGFYIFPADAIGPSCGKVMLTVYSEKKPNEPMSTLLTDKQINRIWTDFEPYRSSKN